MTDFQFNVYRLRKLRNVKQKDFAKVLGMNVRTYVTKERGQSKFDEVEIVKIKEYFDVTFDYLFLPQNSI